MIDHEGKRAAPPARKAIPVRRKLLFTAILLGVTLLSMEGLVRLRAWFLYGSTSAEITSSFLHYDPGTELLVPTPGAEIAADKISVHINSAGFRGPEVGLEKPPGTVRIACVGGSTTFCSEVSSDAAAWPAQLEELLRARYPTASIEVFNAGIPGCRIAGTLANLRHRVLPYDPDAVILYHAHNDIVQDSEALARAQGLIQGTPGPGTRLADALSGTSLLFDLVRKNFRILQAQNAEGAPLVVELPEEMPRRFVGVLDEIHDLLEERGVALVLSSFLVKYRRDQDRPTQIANADVAFYYMPWMSIEALLEAIDLYNAAIVDYARAHDLPVEVERDAIPSDAEHYADCVHWTDAGCRRMAERMAALLFESGLVERLAAEARTAGPPPALGAGAATREG